MKRIIRLALFMIICFLSLVLVGCKKDVTISDISSKYNKYFENSVNSCKQVTLDYSVSDEDIVIYDSFVKAKFNNEAIDVSIKESQLNSKYVLESNEESYSTTSKTRRDFVNVNFNENYIRTFEENKKHKIKNKNPTI